MASRFFLSCLIAQSIILIQLIPCNEAAKHEHQTQCPTNTKLIKLPDGTFDCLFCSTCPPGKVERIPCNHDKDTVCSICKRGFIYDKTNKTCTQCTVCEPEWCNDKECTDNTDTVCKVCPTKTTPSPLTTKETTSDPIHNGGTTEANEKGNYTTIGIPITVLVVIVIIAVGIIVIVRKRKTSSRHKKCKTHSSQELTSLQEHTSDITVNGHDGETGSVEVQLTQAFQNHTDGQYVGGKLRNNTLQETSKTLNSRKQTIEQEQKPLLDIHQSVTLETGTSDIPAKDMLRKEISDSCRAKTSHQTTGPQKRILFLDGRPPENHSRIDISSKATKKETYVTDELQKDEKEKEDKIWPMDESIAAENNNNMMEMRADLAKEGKRQFRNAEAALSHFKMSVGALLYKGRVVTLFRVGPVYVMTSYSAVKELIDSDDWHKNDTTMTFDDLLYLKKSHILNRQPVLIETSLDIVILRLETDPRELPDGLPLSPVDFPADSKLIFVAFGKYACEKRQISKGNNVIPFGSELLKKAEDNIIDVDRRCNRSSLFQRSIDELKDASRCIWKCTVTPLQSYGSPGFVLRGNSYTVVCMYSHRIPPDIVDSAIVKDIYRFYTGPTMAELYKTLKSRDSKLTDELFSV